MLRFFAKHLKRSCKEWKERDSLKNLVKLKRLNMCTFHKKLCFHTAVYELSKLFKRKFLFTDNFEIINFGTACQFNIADECNGARCGLLDIGSFLSVPSYKPSFLSWRVGSIY